MDLSKIINYYFMRLLKGIREKLSKPIIFRLFSVLFTKKDILKTLNFKRGALEILIKVSKKVGILMPTWYRETIEHTDGFDYNNPMYLQVCHFMPISFLHRQITIFVHFDYLLASKAYYISGKIFFLSMGPQVALRSFALTDSKNSSYTWQLNNYPKYYIFFTVFEGLYAPVF